MRDICFFSVFTKWVPLGNSIQAFISIVETVGRGSGQELDNRYEWDNFICTPVYWFTFKEKPVTIFTTSLEKLCFLIFIFVKMLKMFAVFHGYCES